MLGFRGTLKVIPSTRSLYHIVAEDIDHFVAKIQRYVDQFSYRQNVKGIGGWMVQEYLDSDRSEFYDIIAKFRTYKLDDYFVLTRIHHYDLFSSIRNTKMLHYFQSIISNSFLSPPTDSLPDYVDAEEEFIDSKIDEKYVDFNLSWFKIKDSRIVISK